MQGQYNMRNPAVKRLMKEAQELKDPTEQYFAQPLDDNLFEWHFTIRGPDDSDFDSGIYHGRILLPTEYPMKPPSIILLTPNGRFELNAKICLSISGHHPESWRPSWSIRTAILAIIGFMPTHGNGAIGSLDYPTDERKRLARRSQEWKCQNCGSIKNLLKPVTEASKETQKEAQELASQISFQAEKKKGETKTTDKENTPPSPPDSQTSTTAETSQSSAPIYTPFSMPQNMNPMFPGMPQFPPNMQMPPGAMPPFPPPFPFGQMPMMGYNPAQVSTSNQGQFPPWPPGVPFNPFMPMMPFPGMPPMSMTNGNATQFQGMPNPFMPQGFPFPGQVPLNVPTSSPGTQPMQASSSTTSGATSSSSTQPTTSSNAQTTSTGPSSTATTGPSDSGLRHRNVQPAQVQETNEAVAAALQNAEFQVERPQPPLVDTFSLIVFVLCSLGIALLTMRRLGLFDDLLDNL